MSFINKTVLPQLNLTNQNNSQKLMKKKNHLLTQEPEEIFHDYMFQNQPNKSQMFVRKNQFKQGEQQLSNKNLIEEEKNAEIVQENSQLKNEIEELKKKNKFLADENQNVMKKLQLASIERINSYKLHYQEVHQLKQAIEQLQQQFQKQDQLITKQLVSEAIQTEQFINNEIQNEIDSLNQQINHLKTQNQILQSEISILQNEKTILQQQNQKQLTDLQSKQNEIKIIQDKNAQEASKLKQKLEDFEKIINKQNVSIQSQEGLLKKANLVSQIDKVKNNSPKIHSILVKIENINKILKGKIQKQLECKDCGNLPKRPITVIPCAHIFCLGCKSGYQGNCKVCGPKTPMEGVYENELVDEFIEIHVQLEKAIEFFDVLLQ